MTWITFASLFLKGFIGLFVLVFFLEFMRFVF
jgi:hypothetical protein